MHLFIGENYWLFSPQWPDRSSRVMNSFQLWERAEINLNLASGNLLTHREQPFTFPFSLSLFFSRKQRLFLNQPPPAILSTESLTKCTNMSRLSPFRYPLFVLSVRSFASEPAFRQIDTIPHGTVRDGRSWIIEFAPLTGTAARNPSF